MRYFIDTEFHEYKKNGVDTIELISIALVGEDRTEYYAVSSEFDIKAAWNNEWLRKNVLPSIVDEPAKSLSEIGQDLLKFVDESPVFYGYYMDYDWVVFCWLFGRMIDLPDGWPIYGRDLKQMMDDQVADTWDAVSQSTYGHQGLNLKQFKALPGYPVQEHEHNALDDARWNRSLFHWLETKPAANIHAEAGFTSCSENAKLIARSAK